MTVFVSHGWLVGLVKKLTMVPLADGNSEHTAHIFKDKGVWRELETWICLFIKMIEYFKQIVDATCAHSEPPSTVKILRAKYQ